MLLFTKDLESVHILSAMKCTIKCIFVSNIEIFSKIFFFFSFLFLIKLTALDMLRVTFQGHDMESATLFFSVSVPLSGQFRSHKLQIQKIITLKQNVATVWLLKIR